MRSYPGLERRAQPRNARGARRSRIAVAALLACGGLGVASADERPFSSANPLPLREIDVVRELSPDTSHTVVPRTSALPTPIATEGDDVREPSGLGPKLRNLGYSSCMMPDPGFGAYERWQNLVMGQILLPREGGMREDGGYDVVVHFHGHEAVRKPFVQVARGTVLVGVDLGVGSGVYADAFQLPQTFESLRASITRALVKHSGHDDAHIAHLALSSWSAGYGAVQGILRDHAAVADAVLLFDSLHSGYVKGPPQDMNALWGVWGAPLESVVAYGKRAAKGEKLLYLTHSAIRPPGYAATSEVADFLLGEIGGSRAAFTGTTPLGAELLSGSDIGDLHVRGYGGADEPAHCAHTELLAEVVRDVLEPRWNTPR